MATRSKLLGHGTIDCQEALGLPSRLEVWHAPFPLEGRLMGVFRPVVQRVMLPMFHGQQELPLRCAIAPQFIGHNYTRHLGSPFEQLVQESFRGGLVATTLHQDSEHEAHLFTARQRSWSCILMVRKTATRYHLSYRQVKGAAAPDEHTVSRTSKIIGG
jgi:hypothetical protein